MKEKNPLPFETYQAPNFALNKRIERQVIGDNLLIKVELLTL